MTTTAPTPPAKPMNPKHIALIVAGGVVALCMFGFFSIAIGAALGNDDPKALTPQAGSSQTRQSAQPTDTVVPVDQAQSTTQAVEQPPPPPADTRTVAQKQAIKSAQSYLAYSAFSRSGLIGQLEFEGFSTSDATFAVDYLDVDWMAEAAESAKNYLEFSSFSHAGLVDQLEFEGFSHEQAEYGVSTTGL